MFTFADRLKELRKLNNMTQTDLGKLLGVGNTTISMYESDKSTPNDEIKLKISEYFNVSLDWLMGKSDVRSSTSLNKKTTIPIIFNNPDEAREYISSHDIFGSNGFKPDLMSDEQILEFANELLKQMEMVSYKYR